MAHEKAKAYYMELEIAKNTKNKQAPPAGGRRTARTHQQAFAAGKAYYYGLVNADAKKNKHKSAGGRSAAHTRQQALAAGKAYHDGLVNDKAQKLAGLVAAKRTSY